MERISQTLDSYPTQDTLSMETAMVKRDKNNKGVRHLKTRANLPKQGQTT